MISARMLCLSAAGVFFANSVAVRLAAAQSVATFTRGISVLPVPIAIAPRPGTDSAKEVEIPLPAVFASGAPRSYQVVSIPIPDVLVHASNVEIEIVPHGEFVVLGPRTRVLDGTTGRKNRIGVTIGIPATALAGRLVAAEARFSSPGSPTLIVPIELDVNLVKQIILRQGSSPIHAQAGNDVIVSFDVVNSGNAREMIDAELTLPTGWTSRDIGQKAIAVGPAETVRRRVRLAIPPLSSSGSSFVRIDLRQGTDTLASETVTVEVLNSSSIGNHAGPVIVSALSHAADENGRPNTMFSVFANGPLYDSVRIDARMSRGPALSGATGNAFARLGTFQSSGSVVLSAPSGELSLGNTGTSFSELTGLYPYGQGVLLHLQHSGWALTGLGARSIAAPELGRREPILGLHGERHIGDVLLTTSISHLSEASNSPRRLDAIGVGAAIPSVFGSTFKAEIAERRFAEGSGFGWSTEMVRTSPERSEQFRVTRAPGGSDAFARAERELVANISEPLTRRANVSASAWRTTDASSVFSGLKSSGFSVRPQYQLRSSTTLAVEMRSYLFDATSRPLTGFTGGGFGNREDQLGISLSTYVRQYYLNTSAFLGNVTHTVSPLGGIVIRDRSPRNYWMTSAGWSGSAGVVEFHSRIEQTRDGGGFVNQQSVFGVRGDQVVLPWFGGVRAEGDLQRVNGFGDEKSAIMRAGLAIPIMNGFAVKVDAERNSIFHSISGRVPWILGVRFEHALIVPMIRRPGTSGYIYQDLNGNQRRDAGEPGVPGALVRRGPETATADGSGKYRVGGDVRQPIVIDEASLPEGWGPSGVSESDLALSLSTSAVVELVVAARSGISAVDVDLSRVHVIARDSAGREWGAKMTGPSTATFEALPVGTYTLEFDLAELSEPLVPRSPLPPLVVTGKDSRSITVTLDPRPVRMWTPPGSHGGGAQKTNTPATEQKSSPVAGQDLI